MGSSLGAGEKGTRAKVVPPAAHAVNWEKGWGGALGLAKEHILSSKYLSNFFGILTFNHLIYENRLFPLPFLPFSCGLFLTHYYFHKESDTINGD